MNADMKKYRYDLSGTSAGCTSRGVTDRGGTDTSPPMISANGTRSAGKCPCAKHKRFYGMPAAASVILISFSTFLNAAEPAAPKSSPLWDAHVQRFLAESFEANPTFAIHAGKHEF